MNEQIRNLENEILVLMTAKNDRGQRVHDVDLKYKRAVFAKQVELEEMKTAYAKTVRISPEDQKANADYAAYVERNMAKQALMNDNEMPLAHTLKAQAIARGETPTHVAPSGPQPVGRGGIFSRAG